MAPHELAKYVSHHHGTVTSHRIEGEPSRAWITVVFEENGLDIAKGGLVVRGNGRVVSRHVLAPWVSAGKHLDRG
jgi:hypothetical protein